MNDAMLLLAVVGGIVTTLFALAVLYFAVGIALFGVDRVEDLDPEHTVVGGDDDA